MRGKYRSIISWIISIISWIVKSSVIRSKRFAYSNYTNCSRFIRVITDLLIWFLLACFLMLVSCSWAIKSSSETLYEFLEELIFIYIHEYKSTSKYTKYCKLIKIINSEWRNGSFRNFAGRMIAEDLRRMGVFFTVHIIAYLWRDFLLSFLRFIEYLKYSMNQSIPNGNRSSPYFRRTSSIQLSQNTPECRRIYILHI